MAFIQVTSAEMRAKADELELLNSEFKTKVEALTSTEGELSSMWEGDAKTAFHNSFNADKGQMDTFYNAIANYVATLRQIAAEYDRAEATNAQTASSRTY